MKENLDIKLSKRNRRGLIILGAITLMVIYFPRTYFFFQNKEKISIESFPSQTWVKEHTYLPNYSSSKKNFSRNRTHKFILPRCKFDPNTYSKEDWMRLGLSEKQSDVVLKFSERGIYSNEALKKIFVIPDQLYNLIKDSTFYPQKQKTSIEEKSISVEKIIQQLELNQANEEELLKLKGIGAFFSKQIIKKRNELGGFVKKEQLLEVWKMDEEKYEKIKDQVTVNPSVVKKINLNSVEMDQLKIHPYIRWNIANSILKMRDQKNGFKNIEEIKESVLINEELFEKLKPYLSL